MRTYGVVRELVPIDAQQEQLRGAVGAVRFAQNWAVRFVKAKMDAKEQQSWSAISLHAAWRAHRNEVAPWYSECSKETFQFGCERAARALSNWDASKKGKRQGKPMGFPRFRKRGHNDSVGYSAARLRACGTLVHLPRIGEVQLVESYQLPEHARITGVFVRLRAGRWFVTFQVREESWVEPTKKLGHRAVGVDAGIGDRFATLSGGQVADNPRYYRRLERRLAFAQKALARKQKRSANRRKALLRVQRVHYRIDCRRKDFIHKFTTDLVKSHDEIVIEDLELHGMKSARKLGKSVSDAAWGEVRRQLAYKCSWYGTILTVADRWFPSSKRCHICGHVNAGLTLAERSWICVSCGVAHDRDANAAMNLFGLAVSSTASACGDGVSQERALAAVRETGSAVGDDSVLVSER